MTDKKKRLLLFDANNLIFKSFFGIKDLKTSTGIPTNAVFGSLKSFRTIVQSFKPDYVIVCWDSGKKTFRHDQDETYKANRPTTDNALKSQFPILKRAFDCLGVPQVTAEDVECDDLIGSFAVKAEKIGFEVVIVSMDRDFYQLCTDNIYVFSATLKKKDDVGVIDANYIRKQYGIEPSQLVDIKSLTGERTDNIQGVKGIGEKTALKLIKEHGNIKNLLTFLTKNPLVIDRYKPIVNSIPIVVNAYHLAKIKTDIPLPTDISLKTVDNIQINIDTLQSFFKEYEFHTFLKELASWQKLFQYKVSFI